MICWPCATLKHTILKTVVEKLYKDLCQSRFQTLYFRCAQGGCIPVTSLCDFNADCMSGDVSDETSCSEYQSGQCDFEHGLCLYSQSYDDKFDWTVATAGTSSYGTGPSIDHTTMTNKGTSI